MPSTPTYKNVDALIELPDSGAILLQNKRQLTKRFKGKYADCSADALPTGTLGTGGLEGYKVAQSAVKPERGGLAVLEIAWEKTASEGDIPLPQDEVSLSPDNLSPRIERHAMFRPLDGAIIGAGGEAEYVMDVVYNATHAPDYLTRKLHLDKLATTPLALKLVEKIRAGNESFYLVGLRYVWSTHFYNVPSSTRGGFSEVPGGPLGPYLAGNIDWLREGDNLDFSGGIWRLTRSWLGAPNGHWDVDIYGL